MIETAGINEGLVLTVQVRTDAVKAAVQLVCNAAPFPTVIGDTPDDVVLRYAKRFEKFIENGRTEAVQ